MKPANIAVGNVPIPSLIQVGWTRAYPDCTQAGMCARGAPILHKWQRRNDGDHRTGNVLYNMKWSLNHPEPHDLKSWEYVSCIKLHQDAIDATKMMNPAAALTPARLLAKLMLG